MRKYNRRIGLIFLAVAISMAGLMDYFQPSWILDSMVLSWGYVIAMIFIAVTGLCSLLISFTYPKENRSVVA